MNNLLRILKDIRNSAQKESFLKMIAVFGLALIILIVNLFFLPPSVAVINLVIFSAATAIAILGYVKTIRSSIENQVKNLELETVIQNIRDGVVVYDTNFRILSLNKPAEEIFGLNAGEVLRERLEPGMIKNPRLKTLIEIIFPSLAPLMNTISASGWPQIIDLTLEEPHREIRTALNRIINEKNEVVGFLKIITDMTREKNIVESKTEFISVAAHQLRTPLTALNWSFESLNKILGDKNPNLKDVEGLAKEGWQLTERSLKIVNDLLNAARIEEGRFGFDFEETDVNDFLGAIVKQAEPIAKEYGIKMVFSPSAKKYSIKIDKQLLGMAFSNLLDNGIKYNVKNGNVDIVAGPDSNPDSVRIEIRDTGVGIPKEDLGKMFQKFYRGTNVVQMEPNGSGLGLFITKNIIERHGGKISIDSQIGRGTVFSITLPAK
ncbi:MAG: PAS domain-containing sensor histidine kinase [Minisyncoccia bacterium]